MARGLLFYFHPSPLEDKSEEFFNSADTYYADAELVYEQLLRSEPTSTTTS